MLSSARSEDVEEADSDSLLESPSSLRGVEKTTVQRETSCLLHDSCIARNRTCWRSFVMEGRCKSCYEFRCKGDRGKLTWLAWMRNQTSCGWERGSFHLPLHACNGQSGLRGCTSSPRDSAMHLMRRAWVLRVQERELFVSLKKLPCRESLALMNESDVSCRKVRCSATSTCDGFVS